METESKKLRIESDVYDKTLLELREKLSAVELENSELSTEVHDLRTRLLETRQSDNVSSQKDFEDRIRGDLEKEFNAKMEQSKNDLIERWKVEARLQEWHLIFLKIICIKMLYLDGNQYQSYLEMIQYLDPMLIS